MGKRDRRELQSRLIVLVSHLLKWHIRPDRRAASWSATIHEQRRQISKKLRDMPSLRHEVGRLATTIYADARRSAAAETGIPEADFPDECPFAVANILSDSLLPK
jgi:hypothetical protein